MNNTLIKKLEKRDREDSLEVEDILRLIHTADSSLILPLKDLSKRRDWQEMNDQLVVPFASWTNIVCDYLAGGVEKMIEIGVKKNSYSYFALSVLETLKTVEGTKGLSRILAACDLSLETDYHLAIQSLSSLNLLLSFNKNIALSNDDKNSIRLLIESKLDDIDQSGFKTDADVAICLYSLREVGNEETIHKVKSRTPLQAASYRGIEKQVIKRIKSRYQ